MHLLLQLLLQSIQSTAERTALHMMYTAAETALLELIIRSLANLH
jgi:hypothetical protein